MEEPRISTLLMGIMTALALILDLFQLILTATGVGAIFSTIFVTAPFYLIFGTWFGLLGINFFNPKNGKNMLISTIIEIVPVINSIIPTLAFMVFITCLNSRQEDSAKIASTHAAASQNQNNNDDYFGGYPPPAGAF